MKKPSELSVDVGAGAQTTALVYPAEPPRHRRRAHPCARRRRRSAQSLHGRLRRRAGRARHRHHHLQFPLHRTAAAAARSRAGARILLSRRRRSASARRGQRAATRSSSAASRWADASPRRSPPRTPICRSPVSCCSAIRFIRPAAPTTARRAPAGCRAAGALRAGEPRRVRNARRARSRSSPRMIPTPTLYEVDRRRSFVQVDRPGSDADSGGLRRMFSATIVALDGAYRRRLERVLR